MNTIEVLEQLIKIPSVTDSPRESEPLDVIKQILDKENISYKIYGEGTKLNLVAEIGKGKKSVLLNGHFDVVPAKEDMFVPKIEGDKMFARGAADAKSSLTAMLQAFIQLNKNKPEGKIILCCVCDEENAGEKGTKILAKKGIVGDYNIAGEPTSNNIITSEKGFLRLTIKIKGRERHAAFPKPKENAIYLASHVIRELQNINFKKTHLVLGQPTISFGLIKGGSKINIGAGNCEIGIDIRYLPNQSEKEIIALIEKTVKPLSDIKVEIISSGIPLDTPNDAFLVKVAKSITKGKIQGVDFGTDARFYTPREAIVVGPGKSELAHQEKEYVVLSDVEKAAKYYEEIVRKCISEK